MHERLVVRLPEGHRAQAEHGDLSPSIARLAVARFAGDDATPADLTPREKEILAPLAKGHAYADVARALGIGLAPCRAT